MNNKNQILAMLKEEFNNWEELLASLDKAQITAPQLPDNWSMKDVMAHLMAWQQLSIARLEAALHNREPVLPAWPEELDPEPEGEPDELNAWFYQSYREQPWSTVYQAWRTGFLRFLELAEVVPEKDLLEAGKYPWLEDYPLLAVLQGSYEHHREHFEPLSAWLEGSREWRVESGS
jgi:hypothetical protein